VPLADNVVYADTGISPRVFESSAGKSVRSLKSLAAVLLLVCVDGALAQSASDSPGSAAAQAMTKAGWKMESGMALHAASTTRCPAMLPGFDTLIFTGPAEPNILGTCTYKDNADGGDTGMQVRRYMRDVGESRDAIVNDRALMEPRAGANVPFMMVRFTEITTRDGKPGGRMVITKAKGGFLVDCFGEGESLEKVSQKIGLFCAN